jgi:hypothetical protein
MGSPKMSLLREVAAGELSGFFALLRKLRRSASRFAGSFSEARIF